MLSRTTQPQTLWFGGTIKGSRLDSNMKAIFEVRLSPTYTMHDALAKLWANYTNQRGTPKQLAKIQKQLNEADLTRMLAERGISIKLIEPCRWFAGCTNEATCTTPHPVLGDVPTCDRCHKFATS